MIRFIARALIIAWALWFGGIVMLFLCAQALFIRFSDRQIAGAAASSLFLVFERYQLILAAIAIVAAVIWRWLAPSRRKTAFFILLSVAAVAAVASAGIVTPRLEAMRLAGTTKQPAFAHLHGLSMILLTAEALVLLVAGLLWAWQPDPPARPRET